MASTILSKRNTGKCSAMQTLERIYGIVKDTLLSQENVFTEGQIVSVCREKIDDPTIADILLSLPIAKARGITA